MSKLPKWFKGELYKKGELVTNPFTSEGYKLNAEELSMYDFIMGAQFMIEMSGGPFSENSTGVQKDMVKGLDWFRKNNKKAYKVLLD